MDNLLSRLEIKHWYHAFAVLGAVGAVAALAVDLKGIENAHALALFLGIFLVGIGEWINHPIQQAILPPNLYMRAGGVVTGYPRNAKPLGMFFDAIGIGLVAVAAYKIYQTL